MMLSPLLVARSTTKGNPLRLQRVETCGILAGVRVRGSDGLGLTELTDRSVRAFLDHQMTTYAAALAYRGLFGLFPLALLLFVLLGVLDLDDTFERTIERVGSEVRQGDTGVLVSIVEEARKKAGGGLLSFGVAISLYSIYALGRTLMYALNAACEVGETRPAWKRVLLLVAFGPALATATVAAVGAMLVGSRLAELLAGLVGLDDTAVTLWTWLRVPVALLLLAMVLSVVYHFAPAANQPYRLVTPGAAVAVMAWIFASLGFSIYLANFADYGATYGSLGAAIGLLFYLYLTASVVLFGAEVNAAVYSHLRTERTK
jgi:membrane protein